MNHKLPNYLRTYRKRSGLSQSEVAFLLGSGSRTKVSRYERHKRLPGLETIIAYEVIFRTPCGLLFEGLYQEIQRQKQERAHALIAKLLEAPSNPATQYKIAFLKQIYEKGPSASQLEGNHHES